MGFLDRYMIFSICFVLGTILTSGFMFNRPDYSCYSPIIENNFNTIPELECSKKTHLSNIRKKDLTGLLAKNNQNKSIGYIPVKYQENYVQGY